MRGDRAGVIFFNDCLIEKLGRNNCWVRTFQFRISLSGQNSCDSKNHWSSFFRNAKTNGWMEPQSMRNLESRFKMDLHLPTLKLGVRPWKLMVGRQLKFPFGFRAVWQVLLAVSCREGKILAYNLVLSEVPYLFNVRVLLSLIPKFCGTSYCMRGLLLPGSSKPVCLNHRDGSEQTSIHRWRVANLTGPVWLLVKKECSVVRVRRVESMGKDIRYPLAMVV